MDTLDLADNTVRYEVRGDGDPVVLLHANPFVDWYLPVIERMPHYSFVRYTRLPRDDTPMARDAATCVQLAEHLGWGPRPHPRTARPTWGGRQNGLSANARPLTLRRLSAKASA
jgi:hypothetical protein